MRFFEYWAAVLAVSFVRSNLTSATLTEAQDVIYRLVKWAVIGTVTVGAAGFVLFGTQLGSYLGTAARSIREGVAESIPIDFELKRAQNLIRGIEPQMHDARRELAQAEVDLQNAQEEVGRLEKDVQSGERKLRTVSSAMDGTAPVVRLASSDRVRVEIDLERTFDAYKNHVALLDAKKKLIARQERAVAAARQRVEAVKAEKSRLEDMVAALTTQKRQLDAVATSSRTIELDDSALGRAREVLEQVKNRLDVAQKMLDDEVFASPQDGSPRRDIVGEIQRFFGEGAVDKGGSAVAEQSSATAGELTIELR